MNDTKHVAESPQDRLHSVQSAAELLGGVGHSTIRMWLTQGRLTRLKIGRATRVYESELLALIEPQQPRPTTRKLVV